MVTATTGTMTFRGVKSGRKYTVSCYISDVIGAAVTFNPSGAAVAGSNNYYVAPEDVVLDDASIITGPTVATGFNYTSNSNLVPASATLLGSVLTTIQTRNIPQIGFMAGRLIGAVQF